MRAIIFLIFLIGYCHATCRLRNKDLPCRCVDDTLRCTCLTPQSIDLTSADIENKKDVTSIQIRGCIVKHVNSSLFIDYAEELTNLELIACQIDNVDKNSFAEIKKLQNLFLSNHHGVIEMEFPLLPKRDCPKDDFDSHISVTIYYSSISTFDQDQLICVDELDLSHNDFSKGFPKIDKLSNLIFLQCDNCKLEFVPMQIPNTILRVSFENNLIANITSAHRIPSFTNVEMLSFANNRITYIATDAFYSIHTKTIGDEKIEIDFTNNRIRFLEQSVFYYMAGNELGQGEIEVNLSQNPIECSCYMQWILSLKQDMPHVSIKGECLSPPVLNSRALNSLKVSDFNNLPHCTVSPLFLPHTPRSQKVAFMLVALTSVTGTILLFAAIRHWNKMNRKRKRKYRKLDAAGAQIDNSIYVVGDEENLHVTDTYM